MLHYVNTTEAAQQSGISHSHIQYLLRHNIIKGIKPSRDWLVDFDDLMRYAQSERKKGRKPKHLTK